LILGLACLLGLILTFRFSPGALALGLTRTLRSAYAERGRLQWLVAYARPGPRPARAAGPAYSRNCDSIAAFRSAAFWRLFAAAALLVLTTAMSIAHAQFTAPAIRETLKVCEYLLLFTVVYAAARLDPDPKLQRSVIGVTVLVVAIVALVCVFVAQPVLSHIGALIPIVACLVLAALFWRPAQAWAARLESGNAARPARDLERRVAELESLVDDMRRQQARLQETVRWQEGLLQHGSREPLETSAPSGPR